MDVLLLCKRVAIKATVLGADGSTSTHVFDSDEPPVKWMQDIVGGLIDFVPGLPCTIVVKDGGASLGLPVNELAMQRFGGDPSAIDGVTLRGNVIVIEHLL
jgi:hypothetical protein